MNKLLYRVVALKRATGVFVMSGLHAHVGLLRDCLVITRYSQHIFTWYRQAHLAVCSIVGIAKRLRHSMLHLSGHHER